jgi:rRNA processing protein Krr1/Pno1
MSKELTFTIIEKSEAQLIIDSESRVCGIFSNVAEAETAIPRIARNIAKGKVNMRYANKATLRPHLVNSYQGGNKKRTPFKRG